MASPRLFVGETTQSGATGLPLASPAPFPVELVPLPAEPVPRRLELAIGDIRMQRLDVAAVIDEVLASLEGRIVETSARPLAIGSVNLDHLFHFGARRREARTRVSQSQHDSLRWLMLIDGSPVARRARNCTGQFWPRLTGADLLPELLGALGETGARVGFLGGSAEAEGSLRAAISRDYPGVGIAGVWTPPRDVIDDPARSAELALEIAAADVDLLVVGLGKPRQEEWIARYGLATQAKVLTAFGAAAGFLAGSSPRAPMWMRRFGIEWTYRLAREPRRLWRRYLVQGPVALRALLRDPVRIDHDARIGVDAHR